MARTKLVTTSESTTQIILTVKSTKLTVREIEKITNLVFETLSTSAPDKTLGISEREIRAVSSVDGTLTSIQLKIEL